MKAKIIICLGLSAGLFSTVALADNPSTTPATLAPAASVITSSSNTVVFTHHRKSERTAGNVKKFNPDNEPQPTSATDFRVAYSQPPSSAFTYDSYDQADWYPSVTFRF